MKIRILSGLVMAPLLVLVYFGGHILMAFCLLIGIFMAYEFYKAFKIRVKTATAITAVSSVLLYLTPFINTSFILVWAFLIVVGCMLMLFRPSKYGLKDTLVTLAGNFYIVFFIFHVPLIIYYFGDGRWLQGIDDPVWLVMFTAFGTDIFAYFTGLLLGRHKLCPDLSPKKTVEGAIGGMLGSTLICGIYAWLVVPDLFAHCIAIGVLGSAFAQLGDLTASAIKRKLEIKDYSNLIPGHGGLLDRFDSVLFTAPFVFHYLNISVYVTALIVNFGR